MKQLFSFVAMFFLLMPVLAEADQCRCKLPQANLFRSTGCPTVKGPIPAAAVLPAMDYRAIYVEDLLRTLGTMANIEVCYAVPQATKLHLRTERVLPWPELVSELDRQNQLKSEVGTGQLLIRD